MSIKNWCPICEEERAHGSLAASREATEMGRDGKTLMCFAHAQVFLGSGGFKDSMVDKTKVRYGLIPHDVLAAVARGMTYGALHYDAWNWKQVENWRELYFDGLMRHIEADRAGEYLDPKTGEPHLALAMCNLTILLGRSLMEKPVEVPTKWMREVTAKSGRTQ